ncbi:Protein phosphatase 2C 6 [Sporothrix stenoceras]|uniref:Protein phosphatase 2C 6 n=1 Tax=Sporothrix stenoceras TaxID=5173 RepID=A0ABR3ZWC7_9PEZI
MTVALPVAPASRRFFHNYFVTHIPSSSLHPDSRHIAGPHHKLPRAASVPHTPGPPGTSAPLPASAAPTNISTASPNGAVAASSSSLGFGRDLTVVRIPLRSAKHHFGASNARGSRPYNEDTNQAGTINMPAFAKRAPISLVRSAISNSRSTGEGITADGAAGDPQIFYFAVFDGHGGTECSDFLRDELHGYIEEAATDFGLTSSLRRKKNGTAAGAAANTAAEKESDDESVSSSGSSSEQPDEDNITKAINLQRELLQEYRSTVGGYFRRFKPSCFADGIALPSSRSASPSSPASPPMSSSPTPPVTIESVLTYAFLRADLDFVSAQARKPDPDDPYVSDFPLNQDEILGAPHHRTPSGHGIGGPVRFKGGSTASVALISTPTPAPFWHPAARSTLMVAHVGDTRVLLCETTTGVARPLTRDHHPSSPVEARRLTRFAESLVTDSFGEERISGLANSRAFGDMQSKRIGVSAEPEMERVDLGPAQFSFLVLVSDGVSGTLSDQEIVDVVKEARTPEQGARAVVEYATEVSRDGDNATCLVVRLGGWERRSEGGVGSMGTKEIRDARRAEANDPRRGRM